MRDNENELFVAGRRVSLVPRTGRKIERKGDGRGMVLRDASADEKR